MNIRRAKDSDLSRVNELLCQVLKVHHMGRPDLFRTEGKKYTDEELLQIFWDEERPVFVAEDEDGEVSGYAFCMFVQHRDSHVLCNIKSLYIDDLCVDERKRGMHIGKELYEHVLAFAKAEGCYNVTLNVWSCNQSAMKFYERCGLVPQKIGMEKVL